MLGVLNLFLRNYEIQEEIYDGSSGIFFSNYSGRFSEGVALEISDKISEVFLQGFMAEFLKIFIKYFPNKSIVKF